MQLVPMLWAVPLACFTVSIFCMPKTGGGFMIFQEPLLLGPDNWQGDNLFFFFNEHIETRWYHVHGSWLFNNTLVQWFPSWWVVPIRGSRNGPFPLKGLAQEWVAQWCCSNCRPPLCMPPHCCTELQLIKANFGFLLELPRPRPAPRNTMVPKYE